MRKTVISSARFNGERAGNAGLIATVAMAFAGVLVGALSAYLGQRGTSATASMSRPPSADPSREVREVREQIIEDIISGAPERLPAPRGGLQPYNERAAHPKVVIIIDDMGVDRRNSERALTLPGPVTFSFLPYGSKVRDLSEAARDAGAEIMLHLPMEPHGDDADPGPHALKSNMTGGEFLKAFEWNLNRFEGYTGVNNHMGSKLTEDIAVMKTVIGFLDHRDIFYLDSLTTSDSAARQAARELGVNILYRDVFLDDDVDNVNAIRTQLALAERIARETGFVVVIGHPRPQTLDVLGPWLTTAPARGFDLVFASDLHKPEPAAPPQAIAARPDLRL